MTTLTGLPLLEHLAAYAHDVGCTVTEWKGRTAFHPEVHAEHSLHKQTFPGSGVGRAFDVDGPVHARWRYCRHLFRAGHWHQLAEGIYNGRLMKVSVKDGQRVPYPGFWGAVTWDDHRGHVHTAA